MKKATQKRMIVKGVMCCFLLLFLVILVWTIWSNTALMVNEVSISSDRLPAPFSGFRVAQISDLHNAEFGEDNTTLLQMLSECQPDIIAITGDLIDSQHTNIEIALSFAQESVKIAPTYYVTGNHEANCFEYDTLKAGLETASITVMEDEIVYLEREGETITLLGLADPNFTINKGYLFGEVPAMVSTKLKGMYEQKTMYSILLSHRPELFKTYVTCGIDAILGGHAHGGQFRLPFIGGLIAPNQGLFPRYDAGIFTDHNTNMIVSRGLGNSIVPIRFNNRPEIVLIELNAL